MCIMCGGKLIKEIESCISEFTCQDCDCMVDVNDEVIVLKSEAKFYLVNYGTMDNIEIFQDLEEAKEEARGGDIYEATLNGDGDVYFDKQYQEWNYEDSSDLIVSTPTKVEL